MKLLEIIKKKKTKPCPHCGKIISIKAVRCKWCKRWFEKLEIADNYKNLS